VAIRRHAGVRVGGVLERVPIVQEAFVSHGSPVVLGVEQGELASVVLFCSSENIVANFRGSVWVGEESSSGPRVLATLGALSGGRGWVGNVHHLLAAVAVTAIGRMSGRRQLGGENLGPRRCGGCA